MGEEALKNTQSKMEKRVEGLGEEYMALRAGRANPKALDKISVDYYGAMTPLSQMAAISAAEAQTLVIQPWDISSLKAIEKAILTSDLGINPQNDGKSIRLNFPSLTEERRKELVKVVGKYAEECKVSVRNIRREALEDAKKQEKSKEISEDELKISEKKIQELTDKFCKKIDEQAAAKEKEVLSI